jgi:hypothetical protein
LSTLELTYNSFVNRVWSVFRKDAAYKLICNSLITLSAFILIILILSVSEAVFRFSSSIRTIIFYSVISSFAAITVFNFISFILATQYTDSNRKLTKYAALIGKRMPDVKDDLLNALQVYEYTSNHDSMFSSSLAGGTLFQLEQKTHGRDFKSVIDASGIKQQVVNLFAIAAVFASLLIFFNSTFGSSLNRLINYSYTYIDNTLGIAYDIRPGNADIAKGESIDIKASITFNDPAYQTGEINFYVREVSSDGVELDVNRQNLKSSARNEFSVTLNSIGTNLDYWFEYKGVKSTVYKITVTEKPVIKSVRVSVYPPLYTKLPSRPVEGNEINTITGSKIYIELETTGNIDDAFLEFGNNSKIKLEASDKIYKTSLIATGSGVFKLLLVKMFAGRELKNSNPPQYQLRVYPDEYPHINVLEPEQELSLQNAEEIVIRSRVTDDFGFTRMRLAYKLSKTKYGIADKDFRFAEIPIQNKDATGLEVPYVWNISSLNPVTEDEVEYYVEIYDNDAVNGPKMTRSEIRKIVFPSLEALLNKTEKSKEEIETALQTAEQEAEELKRQLDEIKDQLQRNPDELGLNDPKKQEELQKKIENIRTNLENTRQRLDDLMNDLMNNNQISPETLEKFMEVQQLLQKIDSQELRDALKKLQEALKNLNKDQLREAMKNFKFDEEAFKKALEKTKELLEKILAEQKFGELTQKLDEITKKQDEVKEQTEKTDENDKNKMNEISKTQEQIKKEFEEFQKQLKDLKDKFKELKNEQISKELEKLLNEMQKKNIEQKMNQSSQNLQQGNKNSSQKQQNQLSQDLNELNQKMQDLLAMMMEMENSKLMQKMQEFLDKIQELSQKQGELKEQTEELDKNSEDSEFKQKSEQQQQLQNELSNIIEDMMSLQSQLNIPPQMSKNLGDAYNEMGNAKGNLDNKNKNSATSSQQKAKDALDKVLKQLQQMCQSGNKPGNKPGSSLQQLLQMLQQMIARQQALNQQLNSMLQQGNQGKLSQQQMAEMQRMAQEQETIRKNLQQLNEEFKKQQELDGKKLLGNLDQIQKDMQEVIKDMQENNITPETKKRQEKILQRMLDFQLSAREKDFEQKRQSRPGKNFDRTSPPEIVISRPNIIDGVNQDALELQKESYNEDYEILIQKYMQKIKQLQNNK